jgi:hypothetical protein
VIFTVVRQAGQGRGSPYELGLVHLNELVHIAPGDVWKTQQFLRCRYDWPVVSVGAQALSACLPVVRVLWQGRRSSLVGWPPSFFLVMEPWKHRLR